MAQSFRSPSKVARRMKLLPKVARHLKNWPTFMYHYALGYVPTKEYRFRSGAKLRIRKGVDHVPIIEIFLKHDYGKIPDNSVIVDFGANIGAFVVYAAKTARNTRVYAYEPMPQYFEQLQENVAVNGLEGNAVKCFQYAVAGAASDQELYITGEGVFFPTLVAPDDVAATAVKVHCTTLQEILETNGLEKIDLLKIDIEGAEYDVLYNTPPEILAKVSEIRMEYHNIDGETSNVTSLARFLKERGYEVNHEEPNASNNGNLWAKRKAA